MALASNAGAVSSSGGTILDPVLGRASAIVARVPMIVAAFAFAAGILVEQILYHPPLVWLAALILLSFAALFLSLRRPRVAYAALMVALAFAGAFTAQSSDSATPPPVPIMRYANGDPLTLNATVVRDGLLRPGNYGGTDQSVDLDIESVVTDTGETPINGGVRLTIYKPSHRAFTEEDDDDSDAAADSMPRFVYGQRLHLTARLHQPLNYGNPGAMDYRGYLAGQGISAIGSSRFDSIQVLPGAGGSRFERWRAAARRSVLARIHHIWPQQQAGLFAAMVIGDRAFLSRETRTEYQRSGTYHILVVSGMNVGIFAVVLFWALRRLRTGAEIATILTIVLTSGYALLTDLGAPILRSVLMLGIYQLTRLLYRERAALNAVGTAALAMLVWQPRQLLDPSFQLTFLSVLSIAGIAVPLLERTSQPYHQALQRLFLIGYDQAHPPKLVQWRIELRMIASEAQKLIGRRAARSFLVGGITLVLSAYELVLISLLMQVSLALPMIWYFHRMPFTALFANLAVVPLTGILMPASVLAVALSYVSFWLAKLPAMVAAWALAGISNTVHWLGGAAIRDVRLPIPALWLCLLFVVVYLAVLLLARRRAWITALSLVALCLVAGLLVTARPHPQFVKGALEITAIDIGQGDSFLIVTPEGKTLLLDSGGLLGGNQSEFDIGEDVVSPYLWQRGIHHLDAVAFSHGHSDHIGGMRAVIRNFQPDQLWCGPNVPTPLFESLMQTAIRNHTGATRHFAGDAFDFGGAHFEVLAPARDWQLKKRVVDDDAMVLRISYGGHSALMVGDIGKKVETILEARDIHADLLKVGHHGSLTSTSEEFLHAVHPRYAVISVGARNTFGHPRPEVLERLAQAHVQTFRTDRFGPVTFYLRPESASSLPVLAVTHVAQTMTTIPQ